MLSCDKSQSMDLYAFGVLLAGVVAACTTVKSARDTPCAVDDDCRLKGYRCDVAAKRCTHADKMDGPEPADAAVRSDADGLEPTDAAVRHPDGPNPTAGRGRPDARANDPDATTPDASPARETTQRELAQSGAACRTMNLFACAQHGDARVLRCDGTRWVDDAPCTTGMVCGLALDARQRCVTPFAPCSGKSAGARVCLGWDVAECAADLGSAMTVKTCAQGREECQQGACVCKQACGSACPDLASDPVHCGECGHKCETSCMEGLCTPVQLAISDTSEIAALVVDSQYVYWSQRERGVVNKVPIAGGAAMQVVAAEFTDNLAIDTRSLYVTSYEGLFSIPLSGGARTLLVRDGLGEIATDGAWVYKVVGTTLEKVPVNGGDPIDLTHEGTTDSIVFSEGALYFSRADDGAIRKLNVADGVLSTLVPATNERINALAAGGGSLFYSMFNKPKLWRLPLAGGTPALVAPAVTYSIAADGTHVYWSPIEGGLFKQSVTGGPTKLLAKTQGQVAFPIQADQKYVYWAGLAPGMSGPLAIMKLAK